MVDSIQSSTSMSSMFGMQQFRAPQALTDEQKQKVQDILKNYDKDNVTADDAKSIFKAFKDAGIRPGPGMKEAIDSAGFNADSLRELAKPADMQAASADGSTSGMGRTHHHKHQGTSSKSGIDMSALQNLQSILSKYDLSNLSSDDQTSLVQQLTDSGLMQNGNMIDLGA
jgi:hypothetical protein